LFPFESNETKDCEFFPNYPALDSPKIVSMMHQALGTDDNCCKYPFYFETPVDGLDGLNFQVLRLYFNSGRNYGTGNPVDRDSMVLFLPNEQTCLDDIGKWLAVGENFEMVLSKMGFDLVHVSLPKFEIDLEHDLDHKMTSVGFGDLFSKRWFETTYGPAPLRGAGQKISFKIDEEGARFYTSTYFPVYMGSAPTPPPPIIFNANRPFLYFMVNTDQDGKDPLVVAMGKKNF
jgi:hypothetical protein